MSITVNRLDAPLGAEIPGQDITLPLSDADFTAIHQAFLKHKVVALSGLAWDFDTVLDFGRRFGALNNKIIINGQPNMHFMDGLARINAAPIMVGERIGLAIGQCGFNIPQTIVALITATFDLASMRKGAGNWF